MTFDAVLFDLDGTLLDTEALGVKAGLWTLAQLGYPEDRDFLLSLIGKDDHTVRGLMEARFPGLDFDRNNQVFRDEVIRLEALGIPFKDGVDEIIAQVASLGLPMAIVTSSQRVNADRKLATTGLDQKIKTVITVDDVEHPKPAPDPYLLAANRLGVDPKRCLVFEDSDPGAASAKAAGMFVVQIPDLGTVTCEHADFTANSLLEGARKAGLADPAVADPR